MWSPQRELYPNAGSLSLSFSIVTDKEAHVSHDILKIQELMDYSVKVVALEWSNSDSFVKHFSVWIIKRTYSKWERSTSWSYM